MSSSKYRQISGGKSQRRRRRGSTKATARYRRSLHLEYLERKLPLADLSGFVYLDADADGERDAGEIGVPGALITLTGTDNSDATVTRTAITLNDGSYSFTDISSGTYQLTEQQPEAMNDGLDTTATPGAVAGEDQFTNIVLSSSDTFGEINFGELGLRAEFISVGLFLASTPQSDQYLPGLVARAEELAGHADLAAAIRDGATDFDGDANHAPVAIVDTYTADAGSEFTVTAASGVLANDVDANGDQLTATVVDDPVDGTLTLNPDGSFSYMPDAGFSGTDSFTYVANDGVLTSSSATVTITVDPTGDAPVAAADLYNVVENGNLFIDAADGVLANDVDADGDALTATVVSEPSHGTLTLIADGSFVYNPDADFHGTDSFTYQASDGELTSNTATVTIEVSESADFPVADVDAYSVDQDGTLEVDEATGVLANDSDANGDSLTAELVTPPTNGILDFNSDGSFTYTPAAGFLGTDSFVYQASDGVLASNTAVVTLEVKEVVEGAISSDGDEFDEQTSIIYNADSGELAINAPVSSELTTINIASAAGIFTGDPAQNLGGDFDIDSDENIFKAVFVGSFGSLSFGNVAEAGLSEEFVLSDLTVIGSLDDSGALGSVDLIYIPASSAGTAPIAVADEYSVDEDGTLDVDEATGVLADDSDADGDVLTAQVVDGPANGTLDLSSDGSFTYTPSSGFFGTDSFTYQANDGSLTSNAATVTILVNSINDAPFADVDEYATEKDTVLLIDAASGVLANDSDVDGDVLTAAVGTQPSHGMLTLSADGSFTYIPETDFHGTDTFKYQASDQFGGTDEATVTITVSPANNTPTAENDAYRVLVDGELVQDAASGVLANDSDVDGDALTATVVSQPSSGTLTLNADGSFTYTPAPGFVGTDTFTYEASDGVLTSNAATVLISVNGAANAGIVAGGDEFDEQTSIVYDANSGELAINAPLSVELTSINIDSMAGIFTGDPAQNVDGSFDIDSDTTIFKATFGSTFGSFSLGNIAETGLSEEFLLADLAVLGSLFDGSVLGTVDLIYIPESAAGEAPIAVNDTYTVDEDDVLEEDAATGVLANDTDADGDLLTAQVVGLPANGTLVLNSDGSFTYTPTIGSSGPDSFTYQVSDGLLTSNTATVTITVNEVSAGGDGAEFDEQTSIVYDANTGELAVNAPLSTELTSINIESVAGIFTGGPADSLGGSFDIDTDHVIFKATFGSSFGSLSFGNVAAPGLSEEFLLSDLAILGSLADGNDLGDVDLIYTPDTSSAGFSALADDALTDEEDWLAQ